MTGEAYTLAVTKDAYNVPGNCWRGGVFAERLCRDPWTLAAVLYNRAVAGRRPLRVRLVRARPEMLPS